VSILRTIDLSKRFRGTQALDGLSLNVPEGSVFALIGANGAGKTTAIKILMNIHQPTSGSAEALGVDSRRLSPREFQQIGYVSETRSCFWQRYWSC
jgi:ABC-2 type transport system ATP-binding protein